MSFIGEMPLLKYSALQEYLKQESPGTSYGALQLHSLITFIRFEKKYPVVEQICRRGIVSALAEELQYLSERNEFQRMDLTQQKVCNALKLSEHFTKMLIAHGGWKGTLIDLQRLYALDPNMRPEDYEWIVQHNIDIGSIERVFQETPMTIMRMCAYLENVRINQCFEPSMAINDWCDYLKAAKTIEVDLTDNKAKYPSSLKREHDRAMAKQKLVMDEKKDEFFQKETERYGKLFSYKTDGYLVMPPKNMKDLFEEGRKLCHCVGSYSDRIIQGQTCILFVRKAQEPEKPYFTIEVNPTDKCVVQLRGLSNRLVNQVTEKPLIDFLKEWGEKKHIQLKKAV
ncbi:MAG TPA: PcfJ domain-containing protein [Candidatus Gallacutalibacter stercoravium]|nr:PcfJ domain-containing protein [Candidatus Gallacutalibacter stercoravium]